MLALAWSQADKKASSYKNRDLFAARPILLVCHTYGPPLYDIRAMLDDSALFEDYDGLPFAEVWLMDMSDEYWSQWDPRHLADLYGLKPRRWRGFYRGPFGNRKPFG